jgi:hypothetical protein
VTHARPTVTLALLFCLLVASCDLAEGQGTSPPLSPVPGPSQIDIVGTVISETSRNATSTEFKLSDGRVTSVDFATKRRIGHAGASPAILVVGRDERGGWVAIVGHQDGTPDGCHVLNQLGYELGNSIVIGGVRWTKSPGFRPRGGLPSVLQPYPQGSRFCLDEKAQVIDVIAP